MSAPVSGMPLHIKCAIARLLPPVAQGRVFCGPAALCLRETRSQWHRHSCLCAFASAARRLGVKILLPACLSVLTASAATATPPSDATALTTGFAVLAPDPASWPQILSSIGFQPEPEASAGILILRPGSLAPAHLTERIEQGAIAILEGASPAAESFGFRATKDRVSVVSVEDVHRPALRIIWERAIDLPRFEIPR